MNNPKWIKPCQVVQRKGSATQELWNIDLVHIEFKVLTEKFSFNVPSWTYCSCSILSELLCKRTRRIIASCLLKHEIAKYDLGAINSD